MVYDDEIEWMIYRIWKLSLVSTSMLLTHNVTAIENEYKWNDFSFGINMKLTYFSNKPFSNS